MGDVHVHFHIADLVKDPNKVAQSAGDIYKKGFDPDDPLGTNKPQPTPSPQPSPSKQAAV